MTRIIEAAPLSLFNRLNVQNEATNRDLLAFLRSVGKTKLYHVYFPLYKSLGALSCQSTGKETIYSMVKKRLQKFDGKNCKPQFENMVFLNANSECLNVGLPVGELSTEEIYKCVFKRNLVFAPGNLSRQYYVELYDSRWKLGRFFVSFSDIAAAVSPFSKIIQTKMEVNYFENETIFEALVRDGRFNEERLRYCVATLNEKRNCLSFEALHLQGKCIEIHSLKAKDLDLPDVIAPQPHPDPRIITDIVKPIVIKQKVTEPACISTPSKFTPQHSSTPMTTNTSTESRKISVPVNKVEFKFNIKCNELTVKNKRPLAKQLARFENFALRKKGLRCHIRELKILSTIGQSVGAIFVTDSANQPHLFGTCFRIGRVHIITNHHVIMDISKSGVANDGIFVNFEYEGEGEWHSERRFISQLVVKSEELDYAVLTMKELPQQLPPCIFSHGVSIMDPAEKSDWSMLADLPLRLIGHPQGEPKQADLTCIVDARPQSGRECFAYTVSGGEQFEGEAQEDRDEIKNQKRGTYQTSDFFQGSSGSPGMVRLNNKIFLAILHSKGFKNSQNKFYIEQGVLLSEIYKDVRDQIERAKQDPLCSQSLLKDLILEELFPSVDVATQANWSVPMEQ